MRTALSAALAAGLALLPALAAAEGPKVASVGLCADQIVLPLVERERIVGVSPSAADPDLSLVAEAARGLPALGPSTEELVLAGADVVVTNGYGDGRTRALLGKLGISVVGVPFDDDLDAIPVSLRAMGRALGAEARAEALAADFERRMARLRAAPPAPVLAAYYSPDGGSAGLGTYMEAAMRAAGYVSLSARLGRRGWGALDMESLVLNPPDAFVLSYFDRQPEMLGRAFGRHPAFRGAVAGRPVIEVPGRLWGCGGWAVAGAAEYLAARHPARGTP